MSRPAFDPRMALETLERQGVRYVLIGGLAARIRGSPSVTNDADICYARDAGNLERLASALRELGATLRGAPEDVPFLLDAQTLEAGDHFTFDTLAGALDALGTPHRVGGFEELERNATTEDLDGFTVRVAAIDDLIRMKRAAGRPKDLVELEILGALREELEERGEM